MAAYTPVKAKEFDDGKLLDRKISDESSTLLASNSSFSNRVNNYLAVGSTLPLSVGSKVPSAAENGRSALTENIDTRGVSLGGALPQSFGPALPFAAGLKPSARDPDAPSPTAEERVQHYLVAFPNAHDGEVENFSFSQEVKNMAANMRDLGEIARERNAAASLSRDVVYVSQFYSDLYDLGLGSASVQRAMKRLIEQFPKPDHEKDAQSYSADLKFVIENLPARIDGAQTMYDELAEFQERAHARDTTVEHSMLLMILRIPLAIHQALNAFMSLRNTLRGVFLATSFGTSMVGLLSPAMAEPAALLANLFNFIVFLDMLFTHGGESILLSMVGTPDLEQRFEEQVVELRHQLLLHIAASKKLLEATKREIEENKPDDEWNILHLYRAYLENWALDSQVFTNPLNDERMF